MLPTFLEDGTSLRSINNSARIQRRDRFLGNKPTSKPYAVFFRGACWNSFATLAEAIEHCEARYGAKFE